MGASTASIVHPWPYPPAHGRFPIHGHSASIHRPVINPLPRCPDHNPIVQSPAHHTHSRPSTTQSPRPSMAHRLSTATTPVLSSLTKYGTGSQTSLGLSLHLPKEKEGLGPSLNTGLTILVVLVVNVVHDVNVTPHVYMNVMSKVTISLLEAFSPKALCPWCFFKKKKKKKTTSIREKNC